MNVEKTPIYDEHVKNNGRMIDFAGWMLPVEYTKLIEEHNAVRNSSGIFDVSHMGEILISGENAKALVQYLLVNDIEKLYYGRAMYSPMCYQNGGIVDDLLVYMLDDDEYLLVVNASNTDKDFAWINSVNKFSARVENLSDKYFQIAVQGPQSVSVMEDVFDINVSDLKSFHFIELKLGDCRAIVSR
ncbi:MAG: glycine cleavage system aminomethyltransferase GcvT, partial [Oligoflexia bacterium]|nr:glycine cleavage system aminomethyltransferase GcvT [Oligoflexia bacterium]